MVEKRLIRIKNIINDRYTVVGRLTYIQGCKDNDPKLKSKGLKFLAYGLMGQNPVPKDLQKLKLL
ncbi:MAG: hypothetical protein NTV24_05100 [Candidatus Woesebacteria bacterium]|nr:hypothetical protein [Candidatus Woesebacteria bacterium]